MQALAYKYTSYKYGCTAHRGQGRKHVANGASRGCMSSNCSRVGSPAAVFRQMQRVRILFCPLSERRAAPYGTGRTNIQASHINQLILGRDARLNCSRPRNRCAGWLAGCSVARVPLVDALVHGHCMTGLCGAARCGDRDARKTIEAATTPLEYLVHRIPSRCTCEM